MPLLLLIAKLALGHWDTKSVGKVSSEKNSCILRSFSTTNGSKSKSSSLQRGVSHKACSETILNSKYIACGSTEAFLKSLGPNSLSLLQCHAFSIWRIKWYIIFLHFVLFAIELIIIGRGTVKSIFIQFFNWSPTYNGNYVISFWVRNFQAMRWKSYKTWQAVVLAEPPIHKRSCGARRSRAEITSTDWGAWSRVKAEKSRQTFLHGLEWRYQMSKKHSTVTKESYRDQRLRNIWPNIWQRLR